MTQTIPLGSDARERFILEIAAVLAPERLVEAHFFAPLRQGQIETGVCVLAALPEGADPLPSTPRVETEAGKQAAADAQLADAAVAPAAPSAVLDNGRSISADAAPEATADDGPDPSVMDNPLSKTAEHREDLPTADDAAVGSMGAMDDASAVPSSAQKAESAAEPTANFPAGARISSRHVVYSARYRWTRKGPERGKWESEVVAEADAPLLTVEVVVQGVQQRASEPIEVQKIDGDAVRAMIAQAQQQWPKTA